MPINQIYYRSINGFSFHNVKVMISRQIDVKHQRNARDVAANTFHECLQKKRSDKTN